MEICDCAGSSHITGHGYDPETKTMAVRFQSGDVYHFYGENGVEQHEYEAFKNADSKGSHFHKAIRPKFGNGVKQ